MGHPAATLKRYRTESRQYRTLPYNPVLCRATQAYNLDSPLSAKFLTSAPIGRTQ